MKIFCGCREATLYECIYVNLCTDDEVQIKNIRDGAFGFTLGNNISYVKIININRHIKFCFSNYFCEPKLHYKLYLKLQKLSFLFLLFQNSTSK